MKGDARTIAEIAEQNGTVLGFVWVAFRDVNDYDVTIAELNEIAVSESHRLKGIGTLILKHVEHLVRQRGAHLWRSEVGIENIALEELHLKMGFKPYRIEYEKVLAVDSE